MPLKASPAGKTYRTAPFRALTFLVLAVAPIGCQTRVPQTTSTEAPVIPVSHPVKREVTDFADFSGRTDAVNSVGIKARVTGYLVKMAFQEGAEVRGDDRLRGGVRIAGLVAAPLAPTSLLAAASLFPGQLGEGDLLFEVDPRPYQAQLRQAEGQVALGQAQLKLANETYARNLALVPMKAVSQLELDQNKAAVEEARARIKASQASLDIYKLNLEFTRVTAPIDGQISRYYLTLGNLVNQDQTLLTTVVSLDPMYAYFDVDESTLLQVKRAINAGKIKRPRPGTHVPVLMGLQGETGYPHRGTINFVNNVINPSTGTIAFRGIFPNPKPLEGTRLLAPGMFVRIRLPIGQAHSALVVIDRAIGSDQGLKFVYVVDKDNKVQYRRVQTGPLQEDGQRVIEEGLTSEDRIVVGGLPQIRPRMQIKVDEIAMPTLNGPVTPPGSRGPNAPTPGERKAKMGG
jgi:multidrug efflux system membrane fusion protein